MRSDVSHGESHVGRERDFCEMIYWWGERERGWEIIKTTTDEDNDDDHDEEYDGSRNGERRRSKSERRKINARVR